MPASGPPICSALIVVPSTRAAGDLVAELADRRPEAHLVDAGALEAVVEAHELRAGRRARREVAIGLGAGACDERHVAERLDVVDDRRQAEQAALRRERRTRRDLPAQALQAREQRGLLADDVRAGAFDDRDVEREPGAEDVVAERALGMRLGDRRVERGLRERVLRARQHEAVRRADGVARERHALEQQRRVLLHQVLVDVRARVALVAVRDDDLLVARGGARELPLHAGREAGAAAAAHLGLLDLREQLDGRPVGERAAQARPVCRAGSAPARRAPTARPARRRPCRCRRSRARRRRARRRSSRRRAAPETSGRSPGRRSRRARRSDPRSARPSSARAPARSARRARRRWPRSRRFPYTRARGARRAGRAGRRRTSRRRRRRPPGGPRRRTRACDRRRSARRARPSPA